MTSDDLGEMGGGLRTIRLGQICRLRKLSHDAKRQHCRSQLCAGLYSVRRVDVTTIAPYQDLLLLHLLEKRLPGWFS